MRKSIVVKWLKQSSKKVNLWIQILEAYKTACKLDGLPEITKIIKLLFLISKIDDSNGFHLTRLEIESRDLCCFEFMGRIFQYTVLPFGERKSPSSFQRCNMMVVNFLRHFGILISLYLDDRMICEPFLTNVNKEESFKIQKRGKNIFLSLLILVAAGGFLNLRKSIFEPAFEQEFLGMNLNTKDCIVSVPKDKWKRFMEQIQKIEDRGWFTLEEIEEIRGIACSFLFASNYLKYFIREMTEVITKVYAQNKGIPHRKFKKTKIAFNKYLVRELKEWKNQSILTLRRCWLPPKQRGCVQFSLFTDSSLAQLGNYDQLIKIEII